MDPSLIIHLQLWRPEFCCAAEYVSVLTEPSSCRHLGGLVFGGFLFVSLFVLNLVGQAEGTRSCPALCVLSVGNDDREQWWEMLEVD